MANPGERPTGEGDRSRTGSPGEYLSLAKPGLTLMSVGTAVAGALLAPGGSSEVGTVLAVAAGTVGVGGGAVILNQYRERGPDALMDRTRGRAIPAGKVPPRHALVLGLALGATGLAILSATTALAVVLALLTFVVYVLVYTPMKRSTHLATAVGGIPGAIPPVIGWAAVTGSIGPPAYILFLVLFLWQMPHFLALGWMYREDYARGGYRLLTSVDPAGTVTTRVILVYVAALLPASVLPFVTGMGGWIFLAGVLAAWTAFFVPSLRFLRDVTDRNARSVFIASLVYVPAFFLALGIDRLLMLF